jgi:hypothetical protein
MLTMLADLQLDSSEASATHDIGCVLAPYAFPGPDHDDNDIALFQKGV